jgi:hypothetical protein
MYVRSICVPAAVAVLLLGCDAPVAGDGAAHHVTREGTLVLQVGAEVEPIEGTNFAKVTGTGEEYAQIMAPNGVAARTFGEVRSEPEIRLSRIVEVVEGFLEKIDQGDRRVGPEVLAEHVRRTNEAYARAPDEAAAAARFAEIGARLGAPLGEALARDDVEAARVLAREALRDLRGCLSGQAAIAARIDQLADEQEALATELMELLRDGLRDAGRATLDAERAESSTREVLEISRLLHGPDTPGPDEALLATGITDSQTMRDVVARLAAVKPSEALSRDTAAHAELVARVGRLQAAMDAWIDEAPYPDAFWGRLQALAGRLQALQAAAVALRGREGVPPKIQGGLDAAVAAMQQTGEALTGRRVTAIAAAMSVVDVWLAATGHARVEVGDIKTDVNAARTKLWVSHESGETATVSWVPLDPTVEDPRITCAVGQDGELMPARADAKAWLIGEGSLHVLDATSAACTRTAVAEHAGATLVGGDVLVLVGGAGAGDTEGDAEDEGYDGEDAEDEPVMKPAAAPVPLHARLLHIDGRVREFELPAVDPDAKLLASATRDEAWIVDEKRLYRLDYAGATVTVETFELGASAIVELDPAGGVIVTQPGPRLLRLPAERDELAVKTEGRGECGELLVWPSGLAGCRFTDAGERHVVVRAPGQAARTIRLDKKADGEAIAVQRDGRHFLTITSKKSSAIGGVVTFALDDAVDPLAPVHNLPRVLSVSADGEHALALAGGGKFTCHDLVAGTERDCSLSHAFAEFEPVLHADGKGAWGYVADYSSELMARMVQGEDIDDEDAIKALLLVDAGEADPVVEAELFGETIDLAGPRSAAIPIPAGEDSLLVTFTDARLLPNLGTAQMRAAFTHAFDLEIRDAQDTVVLRTCEGCQLGDRRVPMMAPDGGTDIAVLEQGPVTMVLRYTDALGSRFTITRTGVVFRRESSLLIDLLYTPDGRAWLVYLGLMLLVLGGTRALRGRPQVRAWTPLVLAAMAFTGVFGTSMAAAGAIGVPLFVRLFAGTAVVAALLGAASTRFMRTLVAIEPYRTIAASIIALPRVRRRWYAGFIAHTRAALAAEAHFRDAARTGEGGSEAYVPLPADVTIHEPGPGGTIVRQSLVSGRPHELIQGELRGPGPRATVVVIEAPGGRGKSCLKRQVVDLLCRGGAAAERVPVICEVTEAGPEHDLRRGLKSLGDCEPIVAVEQRLGRYVLVYDDAVTRGLKAERLADLCERHPALGVLVVTREYPELVRELGSVARVVVVTPRLLTEGNLEAFVRAYIGTLPVAPFRERAAALRGVGNTYLPVLVRFAIHAYVQGFASATLTIRDVYERTMRELLDGQFPGQDDPAAADGRRRRVDEAIERLMDLCRRSHWEAGRPYLEYPRAAADDRQVLALGLRSGLLVDAGAGLAAREPVSVRFFHDSIRSYLVARWAVRAYEPRGEWRPLVDFLEAVATRPGFRESEIFPMALSMAATGSARAAADALAERVAGWADEVAAALSLMNVKTAAPFEVAASLADPVPARAIHAVLAELRGTSLTDDERLQRTAHFFRHLAVHVAAAREVLRVGVAVS